MTRVQVKRLAPLVVVFLALGLVLLARSDFGVGPSAPYVHAPILQAAPGQGFGVRWRDSTRTKLLIRRVDPSERELGKPWSISTSGGRLGLLSEYDLTSKTVTMREPEEWLASSEPTNHDPNSPHAWKGSPPVLEINQRDDVLLLHTHVPDKPDKVRSVGGFGRVYLQVAIGGDRVALAWCTRHITHGGYYSSPEDRWGGRLYVEFRSLKHPEKKGPTVRLEYDASEFKPPAIAWTWEGSAIVVIDDLRQGLWYVPCPDLSELEK